MVIPRRVTFVHDDTAPVPQEVSAVTGVRSFGDLLLRGSTLRTRLTRLAESAGCTDSVYLQGPTDVSAFQERLRSAPPGQRYLLVPGHRVPVADPTEAGRFLSKLLHVRQDVVLTDAANRPLGAALLGPAALARYFELLPVLSLPKVFGPDGVDAEPVEDQSGMVDLREQAAFVQFLSSGFSARHFNEIRQDRFVVTKRSADRVKMRREATYYRLLPDDVQPFFVQPFDFQEDDDGASYRMRRLYVPDAAVQWVHRAFSAVEFERFLDQLVHFLEARPVRDVAREVAQGVAADLYVRKLDARLSALLASPEGLRIDAVLTSGGVEGGVRALQRAYLAAHDRLAPRRSHRRLVLTHGDLCFSNVLYSQSAQLLQLIDPRGAEREDELYSDPYYDVAKLSHSVLGGYDLVNAGLYRLEHGPDLQLVLRLEEEGMEDLQDAFVRAMDRLGFDLGLVRLYEASLFLSMLPLHIDAPKKVLAFAVRARQVLAELEENPAKPRRRIS